MALNEGQGLSNWCQTGQFSNVHRYTKFERKPAYTVSIFRTTVTLNEVTVVQTDIKS